MLAAQAQQHTSVISALRSTLSRPYSLKQFNYEIAYEHQWLQLLNAIKAVDRAANSRNGWVTLVNPPMLPTKQALLDHGINPAEVRVIYAETEATVLQCLAAKTDRLTVAWSTQPTDIDFQVYSQELLNNDVLIFEPKMSRSPTQQLELFS